MELKRFIYSMIRMFWLILLMCAIGGGTAAYIVDFTMVPMYSASTTVYTLNKSGSMNNQPRIDYQDIITSRQLSNDYQDIIKSEKVISMTQSEIRDLNISQLELKEMISVSSQDNSNIIVISAIADDPKIATRISKAVSKSFISTLIEMTEMQIVGVIDEAKEPTQPIPNINTKPIVLGIACGLGLAILIIYWVDFFDTTIRFPEDVETYTNLSVLGIIPEYNEA